MTQNALYEMLRTKYKIGDHFIAAYLKGTFGAEQVDMQTFEQKLAAFPNLANWLDYALSSNQRGRDFAAALRPHLPHNARRYLDVGSAYGGFLIGFMDLGLQVQGIELGEKFVQMSRANFLDYGLQDAVIEGDILDPDLLPQLGKFDVITCIDVIEHVEDVPAALKNMLGLLNPGGILILQMPNKDSISNVLADPHFGLFGLTLLKHADAKKFYFSHFPGRTMYDVGEFFEQPQYLALLNGLGCESSALPPMVPTQLSAKARLIPGLARRSLKFLFSGEPVLPPVLRLKVALRAGMYTSGFALRALLALPLRGMRARLKAKYADDAWLIIGRKPAGD